MITNNDHEVTQIFILVGSFFALLILIKLTLWFSEFRRELKNLKVQIRRSKGDEKKYWKAQRRRLWLSILPFVKY